MNPEEEEEKIELIETSKPSRRSGSASSSEKCLYLKELIDLMQKETGIDLSSCDT